MTKLNLQSSLKLNQGVSIPLLGLGVYASSTTTQACLTAIKQGYRHIDTAQLYNNEKEVGEAVNTCGLPRSSIFVTSKVWDDQHSRKGTYEAVQKSLEVMKLDYLDLYLLHNPRAGPSGRHQAWLGLQDAMKEGKVKSIGVSNFTPAHITALMKSEGVTVKPAINQIEYHLWNQQKEIVKYCVAEGIAIQAYSPLTQGKKLSDEALAKIAAKHHKTPAQIVLRWVLDQGVVAIPKSENPARIKENTDLYDFTFDQQDTDTIERLDAGQAGNIGFWNPWEHE